MKKLILIALAAVLAACGQSPKGSGREKLAGAGATFPLPYYNLAFKTYRDSVPAEVSYGGIGSGGGIFVNFHGKPRILRPFRRSFPPKKATLRCISSFRR